MTTGFAMTIHDPGNPHAGTDFRTYRATVTPTTLKENPMPTDPKIVEFLAVQCAAAQTATDRGDKAGAEHAIKAIGHGMDYRVADEVLTAMRADTAIDGRG